MTPRRSSSVVTTPAAMDAELAVTFHPWLAWRSSHLGANGAPHCRREAKPRSCATSCVTPPHFATQLPSARRDARQNSHVVTVPSGCNCETAKLPSEQFAGVAAGGIGTADHAR